MTRGSRMRDDRRQRIDGRVDAELGNRARQVRRRVEMRERRRRRRVGVVVGGHVDRLHRRDRALARGRDALLQLAHLGEQRRLVADGRRHAAEQRRHFGTGLREAEDVVDEEQHVLVFGVAEVLGDGERRQRDAQPRAGRFRHLAVDQRGARLRRIVRIDDAALLELEPEVVAFARAFADAAEHRHTAVLHGDVVDELHDDDGLADAGAAEQADLAALQVRLEQVDDLDAGLEHLELGGLLFERRRRRWIGQRSFVMHRPIRKVDRLAEHVQHAPERLGADRHRDRPAQVLGLHAALQAVGRLHRDRAHAVLAEVLLDLDDDVDVLIGAGWPRDAHGVVDRGQVAAGELDVDDRADDLDDFADFRCFCDCHRYALIAIFTCSNFSNHLSVPDAFNININLPSSRLRDGTARLTRRCPITAPARPTRLR